jgi:hypothetical protein
MASGFSLRMQQATKSAFDPINAVPLANTSNIGTDFTKPERPVRIYSHWGSPLDSVGEDGDYVFEEMSESLIGPKKHGKWPEDFIRIEGPVVGKRGCFPRWRGSEKPIGTMRGLWIRCRDILRFLLARAAIDLRPPK